MVNQKMFPAFTIYHLPFTIRVNMSSENLQTDLSITAEIKLYYDLYIPENVEKPAPLLICVAAIECGADKTIKIKKMKATRSSHLAKLFSSSMPADSSSRLRIFPIGNLMVNGKW